MIDIHCHLLPGIDDGPDTIEESIDLAKQMVQAGVTHAILTPHIYPGRWNNTKTSISSHVAVFKDALNTASVPLSIGFAGEVRVGPEIVTSLIENELPFLGEYKGHKVLLLEMPHSNIPVGTDKIISWLVSRNILPMIAHPERNKDVMRRYEKLAPFVEMGCLFQITAGSLIGQFGEKAEYISRTMLEGGLATVLASDAHQIERRPCNLDKGYEAAVGIVGKAEAKQLVNDVPLEIVSSQFIA